MVMATPLSREYVFLNFVLFLGEQQVEYLIVGDTDNYPEQIDSDVDVVVDNHFLCQCAYLVHKFAKQERLRMVQLFEHASRGSCFVLIWDDLKGKSESISLDICGDYYLFGKPILPASKLLQNRRMPNGSDKKKYFFIASPDIEFLYYLTKKIDKESINERQLIHLQRQLLQCPELCLERLQKFWPRIEAEHICDWVRASDLSTLQKASPQLRQQLVAHCRPSMTDYRHEFKRKVTRVVRPTGLVVALLGPDGCGKSTIGNRLVKELAPAFRGERRFHLRPSWLKFSHTGSDCTVVDPHDKQARGIFASLAKLIFFWLDYTMGYWLMIQPLKVRSHLVLFDRYYHDLPIDPKRYRYGGSLWVANLVAKLIPEPDLFLVLDGTPEVIHARKQEVSLAETQRQRNAYFDFATHKKNCNIVRTDQTIEQAVSEARIAVLDFMERRLSKRMEMI